MSYKDSIPKCKNMADGGASKERLIDFLRNEEKRSVIESVYVLGEVLGEKLSPLKREVIESETWRDVREAKRKSR